MTVQLHTPHPKQAAIKTSRAKRKVIRAGRRFGKTTIVSDISVEAFLAGRRVLYATPTQDQLDRYWLLCNIALAEPIQSNVYAKHEIKHTISRPLTENQIRAKTAWDADTLRGDYGDLIILDEFQDMNPDVLEDVVFPMLLDSDGDLIIIYTSKRKRGKGLRRAHQLFKAAEADTTGRSEAFNFTSFDNPYLSRAALKEITRDMTAQSYKAEILAQEIDDDPNALWSRKLIDDNRVLQAPELIRVVVGVDPPGGQRTECGIVCAGVGYVGNELHGFVIDDPSLAGSPGEWGKAVAVAYHRNLADRILGEANYGGDMVELTVRAVDNSVSYQAVHASRGKAVRAEPVVAQYEQGRIHHVGEFPELEDELCTWVPESGMPSPNRLDALVWALTELMGLGVPLLGL